MKNNVGDVRGLRRSKKRKKIMSFMLILAMIFAVMPISVVRAEGSNINEDDSVWSNENYDIPTGTYGSIVIPEGDYHLTIAGTEIVATSVEIQSGAMLHIFDDYDTESAGRLICGNITAQDGACMELGSKSSQLFQDFAAHFKFVFHSLAGEEFDPVFVIFAQFLHELLVGQIFASQM